MFNYLQNLETVEIIFLIIGFGGQGLFASRFIFQWIYSEKKGESQKQDSDKIIKTVKKLIN